MASPNEEVRVPAPMSAMDRANVREAAYRLASNHAASNLGVGPGIGATHEKILEEARKVEAWMLGEEAGKVEQAAAATAAGARRK